MVVAVTPVLDHLTYLAHAVEDVPIENFSAHGAVEALDQSVLCRLTRLDEAQLDQVVLSPLSERMADELRTVVQSQTLRFAA